MDLANDVLTDPKRDMNRAARSDQWVPADSGVPDVEEIKSTHGFSFHPVRTIGRRLYGTVPGPRGDPTHADGLAGRRQVERGHPPAPTAVGAQRRPRMRRRPGLTRRGMHGRRFQPAAPWTRAWSPCRVRQLSTAPMGGARPRTRGETARDSHHATPGEDRPTGHVGAG
ncbi:hypothetical protein AMAG_20247 [Allomyces macrogynus ATCC 38327]|uniref:Uncharacterized protein n=1 Tax=Allomyces macrogynus (strain ATCC 38327) TaxID=578462 RepID=A0A0L0T629_ALLM3|nr:hypothetical protein AMAG_20247 [Allomyces macrogynus ATCC 38327]|eukprot:KNE70146.1 hypothetical protein AMAG_20247 [Allomyces macrogynus ATCC 38327]